MTNRKQVDPTDVVTEAISLKRAVDVLNSRLSTLKEKLRDFAAVRLAGTGETQAEFSSSAGVATIVLVKDSLRLKKGADPIALREKLPVDLWDRLFREEVTLAPGAEEALQTVSRAHRAVIEDVLEFRPVEPRVILPK